MVGLGNPGPRYARTRHNVGFRVVERLAGGSEWRDFRGLGQWCRQEGLLLVKPMTFMNESGRMVGAFAHFHKVASRSILLCFDDVALPLGRLRLRPRGSSGGQKGMESVLSTLGTDEVPRLRVGVGPQPAGMDSAAFVLSNFRAEESELLDSMLEQASAAVRVAAAEGLEIAMNRFNPVA
ncbi:MAG: aminoacyl-tRNA hydrolase [Elusimicrobiota bacterium]